MIGIPSLKLLYSMDEILDPQITIKAIGNQWYWSYEYSDYVFDSGVENPEAVNVNVFATPGIDTDENSNLIEASIEMVEQDRADSLYIVTSPDIDVAGDILTAEEAVAEVVALSPSAEVPAAADIVADVVAAQVEAAPVANEEVADIVSAAVQAVIAAEPEVVTDPVAITAAIMEAVADMPTPSPEVAQQVYDAVAEVIAAATGVEAVAPEVQQQVAEAVATPADPALDAIEARLNIAEAKVDTLLGK